MTRPIFLLALAMTAATARPVFAEPPAAAAPQKDAKTAMAAFEPARLWDGRGVVPFHAADFPKMAPASEAGDFLNDDEYVLGVTVNGESRAYPTRFVWWHHVVNDKVAKPGGGETFFAVTYCIVCNTGVCYDLALGGGEARRLDFYGLYNGVVALFDRDTKSVFLQVSGEFATGPLAGKALKPAPLLDTTWGRWRSLHPNTLVMAPDGPDAKVYAPKGVAVPRGVSRFPDPAFRPTVTRGDLRLPAFDKVLGVSVVGKDGAPPVVRRAYPIKALVEAGGVVNDTLAGAPVAVFIEADTTTALAVSRVVDGRTLTFEARKSENETRPAFFDKETSTRWSLEGTAEVGPLKGKTLARLDNHLSQWYGWAAYYPDTSIFGRDDPPRPGDPFAEPAAPKP